MIIIARKPLVPRVEPTAKTAPNGQHQRDGQRPQTGPKKPAAEPAATNLDHRGPDTCLLSAAALTMSKSSKSSP